MIKPFLVGKDIKRYSSPEKGRYLILIPKGWTREHSHNARSAWNWLKENYPAVANHLQPYTSKAEKRYDKGEYWWELRTCEYYAEFEKPKIIVPAIVKSASYAFDMNGFYSNDKTTIISTDDLYLLGILNSKISDFVIHSIASTKQGGYFEYKPMYIELLPIRTVDFNNPPEKATYDKLVSSSTECLSCIKRKCPSAISRA